MKVSFSRLSCVAAGFTLGASASAAISVASDSFTYSQNFDALVSAAGSQPVTAAWTNDSTIPGWSLFISTLAAPPTYRAEIGNQDIGSFTSYGSNASSDRALGGIGSDGTYFGSPAADAVAGYIAVAFTNNSGNALNSFTVGFSGEEWRYSNAAAQTMVLEYGLGPTFASVGSWSSPGGLFDWTSPLAGGGGLGGVDGNSVGRVSGRGGTVPITWAAGQSLWIRWTERNEAGAEHGLAIDDLTLSVTAAPDVTAVPEPSSLVLLLAGIAAVAGSARVRKW